MTRTEQNRTEKGTAEQNRNKKNRSEQKRKEKREDDRIKKIRIEQSRTNHSAFSVLTDRRILFHSSFIETCQGDSYMKYVT